MGSSGDNTAASAGLTRYHAGARLPVAGHACGRSSAFTLIEVLVSMVILATGIVLILRAFETSLVALAEARDALRATSLLETKFAEIRAQAATGGRVNMDSRGEFDEPYDEYSWEFQSKSTGMARSGGKGTNDLQEVTVTIRRTGATVTYGATTYVRTGP